MAFDPAALAIRQLDLTTTPPPVLTSSAIATSDDVTEFLTALASYLSGLVPPAAGAAAPAAAPVATRPEFEYVLKNVLIALAHTGSSSRETFPQRFRAPVAAQAVTVRVADVLALCPCTLRRLARFYADTIYRVGKKHGLVYEWGKRLGFTSPGWGFDAADYITDEHFLPSDRVRVVAAKRRAVASASSLEADDVAATGGSLPRPGLGYGWDPAGHLDPSHGYARGSGSM